MSRPLKISPENEYRYIQIGRKIAEYRNYLEITQEQLATKTGMSRTYISALEAPGIVKSMSIEALFCIADSLGVKPWDLLK